MIVKTAELGDRQDREVHARVKRGGSFNAAARSAGSSSTSVSTTRRRADHGAARSPLANHGYESLPGLGATTSMDGDCNSCHVSPATATSYWRPRFARCSRRRHRHRDGARPDCRGRTVVVAAGRAGGARAGAGRGRRGKPPSPRRAGAINGDAAAAGAPPRRRYRRRRRRQRAPAIRPARSSSCRPRPQRRRARPSGCALERLTPRGATPTTSSAATASSTSATAASGSAATSTGARTSAASCCWSITRGPNASTLRRARVGECRHLLRVPGRGRGGAGVHRRGADGRRCTRGSA